MKALITLRSGVQIEAEVDSIETRQDPFTGGLENIQWVTPGKWEAKLHYLDVSQVASITVKRRKRKGKREKRVR